VPVYFAFFSPKFFGAQFLKRFLARLLGMLRLVARKSRLQVRVGNVAALRASSRVRVAVG
jgi:hypothetical protein